MLVLENNLKFLALNVAHEGTEKGTGVAKTRFTWSNTLILQTKDTMPSNKLTQQISLAISGFASKGNQEKMWQISISKDLTWNNINNNENGMLLFTVHITSPNWIIMALECSPIVHVCVKFLHMLVQFSGIKWTTQIIWPNFSVSSRTEKWDFCIHLMWWNTGETKNTKTLILLIM